MMTMAAAEQEKKAQAGASAAAHSPVERYIFSRGFAASALKH